MSDTQKIQELAEKIVIGTLRGGGLAGMVFVHDDSAAPARKDVVIAKAGGAVPQLEGFRGYRVDVQVTFKTTAPERNGVLYGEGLSRMRQPLFWRAGALDAGMTMDDDLVVLDEEMEGDRNEGKKIRTRTVTVPLLINKQGY